MRILTPKMRMMQEVSSMALQVNPYQAYSVYRKSWASPQASASRYATMWRSPQAGSWTAFGGRQQMAAAQSYLTDVRKGADALKKATSSLMRTGAQPFEKIGNVSSGDSVSSVDARNAIASRLTQQRVSVKQVSTAQANRGFLMNSDERTVAGGVYRFTAGTGGEEQRLSVRVTSGDTHLDVQKKMATAINGSGLKLTASVETDGAGGMSRLVIEGQEKGVRAAPYDADPQVRVFSLRDEQENGLVSATGADDVARYAQNAVYSVDGGAERVIAGDRAALSNGVAVTLEKTGDSVISYSYDTGGVIDQAKSFLESFNQMITLGQKNASSGGSYLAGELSSLSKTYSRSLARVGLSVQSDGTLAINADRLEQAAASGSLKGLFSGSANNAYGFSGRVNATVSKITSNPMRYYQVSPQYTPKATNNLFLNTMMYGSASGFYTGLLFDAYL